MNRWIRRLILVAVGIAFFNIGPTAHGADLYRLVISVDWEGEEINERDIREIEKFRARHPEVKLVHFFNAAYYTMPGANAAEINAKVRRVILPQDEVGLHIHGWQDLFEAAFAAKGLTDSRYISTNGWSTGEPTPGLRAGHDIPIEQYSVVELEAVISYSLEILRRNGFTYPITSFRAGGWQAGPNVLAAIERQGFTIDSSATVPELLRARVGDGPLFQKANALWGPGARNIELATREFTLPGTNLVEMPGVLFADYVGDNYIRAYVDTLIRDARKNPPGEPLTIHLAFHSETAYFFLDRIAGMLAILKTEYIDQNRIRLTPEILKSRTPSNVGGANTACRAVLAARI